MSHKPNLEEQELLADTLRRAESGLPLREWMTEALFGGAFLAAVAGVWWIDPPNHLTLVPALLSIVVMVFATLVRFDTPFGFTVATQLAFVPLLFAVPLALVPLAVVVAMVTARLPAVIAGIHPPGRLIKEVANAWFAIGPVAVFALAGQLPTQAGPLLLLLALLAQFVVDFAVSTLRVWVQQAATLFAQLSDTWVYAVDAALSSLALVVAEDVHSLAIVTLAPLPMLALLAIFAHERHQRMNALIELGETYHGTARVLGDVIEADDSYTGEHCKSVVALALGVADELELDAEHRRNVEFGALLHDVGKIAIPKEIINKPGKLDPHEWEIIKTHTIEGQQILDRIGGFMRDVGLIVRSHHERWDGGGYPDGLIGDAIALEARIITCCDSWNAMRTDRSYRSALPYQAARAELEDNAGRQFDPRVVDAFLTVVQRLEPAVTPVFREPVDAQRQPRAMTPHNGAAPVTSHVT